VLPLIERPSTNAPDEPRDDESLRLGSKPNTVRIIILHVCLPVSKHTADF
jgi:hypothetical protein